MSDLANFAPDFPLSRLIASNTGARLGIDNTLPVGLTDNAVHLSWCLVGITDLIQLQWPGSVLILNSAYRCPQLNAAVKGAANSAHVRALAADIWIQAVSQHALAAFLAAQPDMGFDQIIQEFTWVHIGLSEDNAMPRNQLLTARRDDSGKITYSQGLLA